MAVVSGGDRVQAGPCVSGWVTHALTPRPSGAAEGKFAETTHGALRSPADTGSQLRIPRGLWGAGAHSLGLWRRGWAAPSAGVWAVKLWRSRGGERQVEGRFRDSVIPELLPSWVLKAEYEFAPGRRSRRSS